MFRSLRHRDFRIFFIGQFISLTGSWMQQAAQAWLVYRMTRDPFALGLVGFAGQIPVFFLGLHAGLLVDRVDRRRLVLATQAASLIQAVVLAGLTLGGRVEVWHVYVLAAWLGAANAFDLPARQVLIGELVGPEDRHNAIALNASIVNGSRIIGPALAGVLIGWRGEGVCFALNAASFLAVLVGLAVMRGPAPRRAEATGSDWSEIRLGISYALGEDAVRGLLGLLCVISLGAMPAFVLLPVFAGEYLGVGPTGLGFLMGAAGAGATAGALVLASRDKGEGLDRAIAPMGAGLAVALIGLAVSRSFALSAAVMAVVGLGVMVTFAVANTLLQELASDRFRGRVMGFYTMTFMGIAPIGNLLAGLLARRIGAPWAVILGAVGCAVFCSYYASFLPGLIAAHRRRSSGLSVSGPGSPV